MLTVLNRTFAIILLGLSLGVPALKSQDQEQRPQAPHVNSESNDQSQRADTGKPEEMVDNDFQIKYLKPCELMASLRQLVTKSKGAKIACNDEQKFIYVRHTREWLDEIEILISRLDIPPGPERNAP